MTDYYTILGVEKDAPPAAIKAAFKKLALQYHPDVYKGADAHERMRVLLLAYQTLNDPAARQQYDAQHSEYSYNGRSSNTASTPATNTASKRSRADVSAGARRDRQRHYDFPNFLPDKPVHIDLIDISYTLTPMQAETLLQQGLQRGIVSETDGMRYYCHRCHHRWAITSTAHQPMTCPKCQAPDWTEYLLLRCIHCCAVFESEQIRYGIGAYTHGNSPSRSPGDLCPPYELFPLCPYCGTAHWSPAEDERVSTMRQEAARSSELRHLLLLIVGVCALVLIGIVVFSILHVQNLF